MSDEKKEKTTIKEKLMIKKNQAKEWVHDHKKSLIKGGVIAGAIAATGGVVAAIVNRCGLPCKNIDYDETLFIEEDYEISEEPEESCDSEESEEDD